MVILNRIGIIILNVFVVLIVPGNQHAPHVVYGPILSGIKKRGEELMLRESWPCPKEEEILSDSSIEEKNHGSTTPHGPAARGKTHKGGNSKGSCPLGSISPPATGHQTTDHRASSYRPITQWTRRHHGPATDHHWARVTGHRPNGHNT